MKYLSYNIMPIAFLLMAVFLAYNGLEYWGWCIFCALITTTTPSDDCDCEDDTSNP